MPISIAIPQLLSVIAAFPRENAAKRDLLLTVFWLVISGKRALSLSLDLFQPRIYFRPCDRCDRSRRAIHLRRENVNYRFSFSWACIGPSMCRLFHKIRASQKNIIRHSRRYLVSDNMITFFSQSEKSEGSRFDNWRVICKQYINTDALKFPHTVYS